MDYWDKECVRRVINTRDRQRDNSLVGRAPRRVQALAREMDSMAEPWRKSSLCRWRK